MAGRPDTPENVTEVTQDVRGSDTQEHSSDPTDRVSTWLASEELLRRSLLQEGVVMVSGEDTDPDNSESGVGVYGTLTRLRGDPLTVTTGGTYTRYDTAEDDRACSRASVEETDDASTIGDPVESGAMAGKEPKAWSWVDLTDGDGGSSIEGS